MKKLNYQKCRKKFWHMGFNLGILISGNGSNMKNIIDALQNGSLKSSVSIVISDNPLAKGLSLANKENVKSVLIDRDKFSSRKTSKIPF